MTASLQASASPLTSEIPESLRADAALYAVLPELLVAGLAIEQGDDIMRITSLLPGMTAPELQAGLSKIMEHPDQSVWYFRSLGRLQNDFDIEACCTEDEGRFNHHRFPSGTVQDGMAFRTFIPPMPVPGLY